MAAKSQDKILFGAALVLLLASAAWALVQGSKISALKVAPNTNVPPTPYVAAGIDAPRVSTRSWPMPQAQSRGPEWIYDVFTPPEIYYNQETKQFSVTPPAPPPPEPPFGVQLVAIKQDVFRLQLVGYIGDAGDERGTFENTITGDTIIGRAGKVIPDLDLTIKSFQVKRNQIISEESMTLYDTEATAVVVDTKTGEEYTLTNKQRMIKGTPFAVLQADGATETVELKDGGKLTVGTDIYTVVTVTGEPPSAIITRQSEGAEVPVTKTLTPPVPVDPVTPSPSEEGAPPAATAPSETALDSFPFGN